MVVLGQLRLEAVTLTIVVIGDGNLITILHYVKYQGTALHIRLALTNRPSFLVGAL